MKIGIVSSNFYPEPGGISEHVYHLYVELRKLGYEVKIITASFGGDNYRSEEDVIRIGRAIPVISNGSISNFTFAPRLSRSVRRILREEQFDILHIHNPLTPTLGLFALKHSRCINIGTFHTYKKSSIGYFLFRPHLRRYARKLHGRIVVSVSAEEFIGRYFPGDYRVIPNGVDINRFRPDGRKLAKFDDGRFNILFVGRLEPRKGLKYLFRAFPLIKKEVPNSRLIVVGNGLLEAYYRKFVPNSFWDDIAFEGFVPGEDLPCYYSSCDVCCFPGTKGESFGIVLLEAMASGKPIVASDIKGYRNVVRDGREGFLVEPKNPRKIAAAVVGLLKNRSLRETMGKLGRRKAENYSWPRVTAQVVNLYHECMERQRYIANREG